MQKRNSSIELIRIIAMMFIIMGHLAAHGILKVAAENPLEIWRGGATYNKLFSILLMLGGRVGVALFFMISGYFQIYKSTVSVRKVVYETVFYSVLLQLVALILKIGSLGNIARGFFPISSGSWWYVSSYVVLMLCSPTINQYYLKLKRKQKIFMIIFAWVFLYTVPYVFKLQYYSLERGVVFYLIGAYIRTEVDIENIRKFRFQLIVSFFFLWTAYAPLGYMFYTGMNKLFSMVVDGIIFNGIIIVGCAVMLFVLFASKKAGCNKTINTIAKSTFGIYLLHDNMYRNYIWDNLLKMPELFRSVFFPALAVGNVIFIFASCFLIDYMRECLFNALKLVKKSNG